MKKKSQIIQNNKRDNRNKRVTKNKCNHLPQAIAKYEADANIETDTRVKRYITSDGNERLTKQCWIRAICLPKGIR